MLSGICGCLIGLSWSFSASAATSDTAAAPAAQDTLEEVIVTAERHEENVQKTPMNVTVIGGADLQKQGLNNMQEILSALPGVTVQGQVRGFDPSIRGLGTDLPPGSSQGAVAVEEDYVYDIRAESGRVGYYDLQRMEVLAGPQGTLYGVNSDGGVVNIITNNPELGRFSSSAQVQLGNYNLVRGEGSMNLPVSDTTALRFAVAAIDRDGFLDTGADDDVGQGARVKYLWKPNDKFSLLLGYEVAKLGGKGQGSVQDYNDGNSKNPYNSYTGAYTTLTNPYTDATSPFYGVPLGGVNTAGTVESDANQWDHYHSNKYWADVKWDMGIANLSFTPAYKSDYDTNSACGMGLCSYGGDPAKLQQNSEELKVSQASGSKLQWNVGLYHWGYLQTTFGAGPAGSVYQTTNAVFGEVTYPVSDALRVKFGARESHDWKANSNTTTQLTFSHFDYRAGIEFDAAPESMEYATVSTGYRPGGFNIGAGTYKTEQVTDFEVGSKNRFLDDRLQLNADAYYYVFNNYQLLDFYGAANQFCNFALNGPPSFPPTLNLSARNFGVDLAGAWLASAQDTVNVSLSYLHAYFNSDATIFYNPINNCQAYTQGLDPTETNSVGSVVLSNAVEPHSPTLSGNISWEHRFTMSNGASFALRPSAHYSSSYFTHPEEDPGSNQPAYATYDLSGTYSSSDGKWDLSIWGRNLSDYVVKGSYIPVTLGEPRTYGVTVSAHL